MKKLFGIGILLILIGSIFVTPALGNSINEDYEELELNRKILLVIGGDINIRWIGRELYGYGSIVYADGDISLDSNFSIDFKGIPLTYTYYFISFCLYQPR
jgi:hypothetical protein